jgi:hypothetical protein
MHTAGQVCTATPLAAQRMVCPWIGRAPEETIIEIVLPLARPRDQAGWAGSAGPGGMIPGQVRTLGRGEREVEGPPAPAPTGWTASARTSAGTAMCSCGDRTSRTRRAPTEQNQHAGSIITVRNEASSPRLA